MIFWHIFGGLRAALRLTATPIRSALASFFYRVGGVDAEFIRQCPERDRSTALIQGVLTTLNWLYISSVATLALAVLFQTDRDGITWYAPVAGVIASLIVGVDLMVIRAAWTWHGMASLRQAGFQQMTGLFHRARSSILLLLRFGLSYLTASLLAALLLLHITHADLEQNARIANHQQNSTVYDAAVLTVDKQIAAAKALLSAAAERVVALQSAESQARSEVIDLGDMGVKEVDDAVHGLEVKKAAAEAEARHYENVAINELSGRGDGASGVAGNGPLYKADLDHRRVAQQEVAQLINELAEARQARDAAHQRREAARAAAQQRKDARITELVTQVIAAREETDQKRRTVDELENRRQHSIDAIAEHDPAYVPLSGGPVEMFKAFYRVAADPGIGWWMTLIRNVAMGLELTAVLAKLLIHIPSTYSTEIAADDCILTPARKLMQIQREYMHLSVLLRRRAAMTNASLAGLSRRRPEHGPSHRKRRDGNRRAQPAGHRAAEAE